MAFDGNLLYISKTNGNYTVFPTKYMKAESYSVLRSGQDIESTRDANGNLNREALNNFLPKVEFETVNMMDNKVMSEMWKLISDRYISTVEKSLWIKAYIPETDSYMTQKCYIPDCTPTIYYVDSAKKKIIYNPMRIAFIGYGKG